MKRTEWKFLLAGAAMLLSAAAALALKPQPTPADEGFELERIIPRAFGGHEEFISALVGGMQPGDAARMLGAPR